jgi:Bacterial sugar transferase
MRHPRSLNCALPRPPGEGFRRGSPAWRPLASDQADSRKAGGRSTPGATDVAVRGRRSEARPVLIATGGLITAVGAAALLNGFDAAYRLVLVGVLLAVAGLLAQHPRLADRTVAALVGMVLLPVLLAIGLAVKLTSPGPVLVRQARPGREGRPLTALRFRTTVTDARPTSRTSADAPTTPIGRILRALCLDELPRLLDVVRGDVRLPRSVHH